SGDSGSAGARLETPRPTMWDSRAETEAAPPSATTAGAVIAQNAELAHGVAWLGEFTARPDGWDAICCSQFTRAPRCTCSHNSGRPTGNTWPLSSSTATSLTSESFMRAPEYTTRCPNGGALARPSGAIALNLAGSSPRPYVRAR